MLEGVAHVARIDPEPAVKLIGRCPVCQKPRFKERRTKTPRFRCDNRHEFDEPTWDEVEVTQYTAWYGASYQPVDGVPASELRRVQANDGDGSSIRRADVEAAARLLSTTEVDDASTGAAYASPELSRQVEQAAVRAVVALLAEERPGTRVTVMPHSNPGYDIRLDGPGDAVAYVEVKGLSGLRPVFFLTEFERTFAESHADAYELYVVCGIRPGDAPAAIHRHTGAFDARVDATPDRWVVRIREQEPENQP